MSDRKIIYLDDAIDAVKCGALSAAMVYGRTDAGRTALSETVKAIKALPPAQPEPIKINIEDFNKEDWERLKKEWGNTPITVLPAQPEIIRCGQCKHCYIDGENVRFNVCELNHNKVQSDDWFCADAKRREE